MKFQNDLEEFLYIISHDFGAPLRHIKGFCDLLAQKLDNGRLDEREKLYLTYIKGSIKEAEDMLSALLRYSRINTSVKKIEPVNINEVISSSIKKLQDKITKKSAVINIDCPQNISISTDKNLMETLITELLDNSIKFSSPTIKPVIEIKVTNSDKEITFSIKDNGIGNISENNRNEVFSVFRRLNSREEFSGTGIGLTLCKRIIDLNRGNIWCESSDENGTEFKFTLPSS